MSKPTQLTLDNLYNCPDARIAQIARWSKSVESRLDSAQLEIYKIALRGQMSVNDMLNKENEALKERIDNQRAIIEKQVGASRQCATEYCWCRLK